MADVALLERHDNFAPLRNALRQIAEDKNLWAGIPMPLEDERLVVEPSYPHAAALEAMCAGAPKEQADPEEARWKLRAEFWSTHKRSRILILQHEDGHIDWGIEPGLHHLDADLRTLGCAEAWGIEQEHNAMQTLAGLLTHRQFKQYLLTGCFLESSKRSKVHYLFRRLKPTVAIVERGKSTQILCALCAHPIAHYAGTWAGAMCPTDDVIAHLQLMRGDEHLYWKRCAQHAAHLPQAGL